MRITEYAACDISLPLGHDLAATVLAAVRESLRTVEEVRADEAKLKN